MVAFDPDGDAVGNARAMQDAIADVRSAEVTRAVRDSELDGVAVRKGQAMGIVDGRLVAAGDELEEAFGGVLEEFADGRRRVRHRAHGPQRVGRDAVRGSKSWPRALAPDAEVHFHEGGQPLYPILASAE